MLFEVAVAVMMALAILWYIFASRNPSPTADPNPSLSPSPTADPSPRPSPTADPSPRPSPTADPSPSPSPSPTADPSRDQEMKEMQVADRLKAMISCKCAYARNDKEVLHLLNKRERKLHDFKQYQLSKEMVVCGAKVQYFIAWTDSKVFIAISVKEIENIPDDKKGICLHPTGLFEGCVSSIVWELANLIPWVYMLEVFRDTKLVISGYYIGGAVAQLVTVLMKCHLRQIGKGLDGEKIRCIAFGAPRFAYDSFTAFTKKTEDDVLIENIGVQDDDGWIEEIVPKQFTPIQQVFAGSFTSIVNCVEAVAQAIGDTGIPGSKYAKLVANVLSAILQLDRDGVVPSVEEVLQLAYGDTDIQASKIAQHVIKCEVSKSRTAYGKLSIDAYLSRMKNHFHRNLHIFDPTDVQPEYLLDPRLQLDAEYHEGILRINVSGGYDIWDWDTFEYAAAKPANVKLMKRAKTDSGLTLKIFFPLDPEVPNDIVLPVQFTCETHFGDKQSLTVPYDTQGLFCNCMKSNGKKSVADVVMKAINRENLFATHFQSPTDEKSELVKLLEKLTEITTGGEKYQDLIKQLVNGSANEKQQTDDVRQLSSDIQEKIRDGIEIIYERTMRQILSGSVSGLLSACSFGTGAGIGLDVVPSIVALVGLPVSSMVLGAGLGAVGVAAGAAAYYVAKRKETVAEQYREVLISILETLLNEKNTRTSCNCKLEKKIHEMAKCKKVIHQNMFSVNETEMKKHGETITSQTHSQLSLRLHAICIIQRMKEILLKDITILVVGQQNHGKTTLVQQLTKEKGQPAGWRNHTEKPTLYKYTVGQDAISLIDMPGSTTTGTMERISKFSQIFGKSADLLIWVYQFSGSIDQVFEGEVKKVQSVGRPVLLCFSKCFLATEDDSVQNVDIADIVPKVPNVEGVIPMELKEDRRKEMTDKKITGVKTADDVGKEIFKWKDRYLKTQM